MRCGIIILPQDPWTEAQRKWRGAEELGFDSAWTYDHLSWRSLADEPWQATVPTLTAASVVTTHIRLGTIVASPNFRHPVPFAKDIATLDEISGGRFVLGVGAGGTGFDAFVLGERELSPMQRHERFAEFVSDLDLLLRFELPGSAGVSFSGEWYTAVNARMVGVPAQQPRLPFVVAANGPKGMRVAAEYGAGWVTTGADGAVGEDWWASIATLGARFEDAADSVGTDPLNVERYLMIDSGGVYALDSVARFEDSVGRAAELGFTEVLTHWPRADGIYAGSEAVLEAAAELLPKLRE
ncbi:alkanesulfonate monooxygenase SsuD/methylene tetrahydromethanopterin reductase-like flavin-dependent oxidoreductase (luciferase family) [Okibacterium sp. HSC-33S16]|uniref:LLM class flavin-dependent oxidoreductase n=1 Tax=Okibacterium sp. HSC-33S16 TaxID=2910965 RepID=UPI00209C8900|nr:LLM class flavin-dependent oxidoreductase [Okibacterium sp. HSC-33S16]MCP2031893.1 alkanesulfonate monooxygenase SsuD/methylene tetrahydromethanopterin reductase-like flavin-dependent oxidoreductase (luciferase family) [Okibacterium sp. HSC-33S16]